MIGVRSKAKNGRMREVRKIDRVVTKYKVKNLWNICLHYLLTLSEKLMKTHHSLVLIHIITSLVLASSLSLLLTVLKQSGHFIVSSLLNNCIHTKHSVFLYLSEGKLYNTIIFNNYKNYIYSKAPNILVLHRFLTCLCVHRFLIN